ncbi:hypothetical protein DFJ73DRAFT_240482, partial [Zopfochytrium polystomum]
MAMDRRPPVPRGPPPPPPGPDWKRAVKDPSVPEGSMRILSRTVYVGGVQEWMTKDKLVGLFQGLRVESCFVNHPKFNAFIKMYTREEAEAAVQSLQGAMIDDMSVKISWGCGFGPKDHFDYMTGSIELTIDGMSENEKRWLSTSPRGGGPIEGGTVVEEPFVEGGWKPDPNAPRLLQQQQMAEGGDDGGMGMGRGGFGGGFGFRGGRGRGDWG